MRLTLASREEGEIICCLSPFFFNKEAFDHLKLVVYEVNNSFRATLKFLGEYNIRSVFKMFSQIILLREKQGGGLRRMMQISRYRLNTACRARYRLGSSSDAQAGK